MSSSILVPHVIDGLVGPPVLCLVGLPVMELSDRWVYLSMTHLLQVMMMPQPLPHPQHPKQVGTLNNPYYFLIHSSSFHPLGMVAKEHSP